MQNQRLATCISTVKIQVQQSAWVAKGMSCGEIAQQDLVGEVERGKGLIKMRRCATADEHGFDTWLMQRPREGKVRLRIAGALCDLLEPCEPLIRRVMKIDLLMPRDHLEA